MAKTQEEIFHDLIVVSTKLATVADNAAVILSEQFESMISGPVAEVRAVLAQCPAPLNAWDGTFREEDCTITYSRAPLQAADDKRDRSCKVVHNMTGITRESYSKLTGEENKAVCMKSLERAVADRFRETHQ